MTDLRRSLFAGIASRMPSREFGRFLILGVFNTFSGYAIYALLNYLLSKRFPQYGYVMASVLSTLINVTIAFLGYKWFVFKTKGNYLREWVRTVSVYSVGIAVTVLLLPVTVTVLRWATSLDHESATYVGGFVLTVVSALWSFFGNKNFSFKPRSVSKEK
jgi:putative flippase GtrA